MFKRPPRRDDTDGASACRNKPHPVRAFSQVIFSQWVKQIDNELRSPKYREVLENSLGNVPQASIIKYLNEADAALTDGRKELAQDYVDRAISVLDQGVQRGWFSPGDIEPMKQMIQATSEAAIKGNTGDGEIADERWTGYTHHRPLGITERLDLAAPPTRSGDEQEYDNSQSSQKPKNTGKGQRSGK